MEAERGIGGGERGKPEEGESVFYQGVGMCSGL